jgi:hypothetical protein
LAAVELEELTMDWVGSGFQAVLVEVAEQEIRVQVALEQLVKDMLAVCHQLVLVAMQVVAVVELVLLVKPHQVVAMLAMVVLVLLHQLQALL